MLSNIKEWTNTSANLLNPKRGRLAVIYPARRIDSLIIAMSEAGLSPVRMRFVHPLEGEAAELVLMEGRRGKTGRVVVEAPLYLKNRDGSDTTEATLFVNGEFSQKLSELPDRRRAKV